MSAGEQQPHDFDLALPALELLGGLIEPDPRRVTLRVGFQFLDGRTFLLDSSQTPCVQPAALADVDTRIVCNGAGLLGLLQNRLGATADQVFLCRGDREIFLALADALAQKKNSTLDIRMSAKSPNATGSTKRSKR